LAVAVGHNGEEFGVPQSLACLLDDSPGDIDQTREKVQVLEIPEESYRSGPGLREPLGVEALGFVVFGYFSIPVDGRCQGFLVFIALPGKSQANEVHVGLIPVALGDLPEGFGQGPLRLAQQTEIDRKFHALSSFVPTDGGSIGAMVSFA
jgi:hypothetical protein